MLTRNIKRVRSNLPIASKDQTELARFVRCTIGLVALSLNVVGCDPSTGGSPKSTTVPPPVTSESTNDTSQPKLPQTPGSKPAPKSPPASGSTQPPGPSSSSQSPDSAKSSPDSSKAPGAPEDPDTSLPADSSSPSDTGEPSLPPDPPETPKAPGFCQDEPAARMFKAGFTQGYSYAFRKWTQTGEDCAKLGTLRKLVLKPIEERFPSGTPIPRRTRCRFDGHSQGAGSAFEIISKECGSS